jgi:hypothetical protein
MRATPLKIITTARRSVQTLIGSNDVFSTKTRAFIPSGYYLSGMKVSKNGIGKWNRRHERIAT